MLVQLYTHFLLSTSFSDYYMLKLPTFSHKSLTFSLKAHNFRFLRMPNSEKVIAEYAKSSRSSCKKCLKTINKDALRLGSVTRDARGFDMTKWHHFGCFAFGFDSVSSVDSISGFITLKSDDQEALKEVVQKASKFGEEGADVTIEKTEVERRIVDKRKGHGSGEENEEERVSKTVKLSAMEDGKVEIAFSVSDVKDTYKEATLLPKWKAFQTVIYLEKDDGLHGSRKIAAFDFDGCLANTSVKRVGAAAWSLMYPTIPDKLKSLYDDGYKLVIFTNESNIERWKNKRQVAVDSKIGRLNSFIEKVKVPIQVFIACGYGKSTGQAEDPYRKPKTGMWQLMEKHFNSGLEVDYSQSFYVGDAAGRPGDHSDADIRFAEDIGLKFYVPEDFFVT